MAITTASQSQIGQETAKNSQIVTTSVRLVNSGASTGPSISSIVVTDSGYNNLDDTAAATSNSYIRILGSNFTSTANVFLNGTMVPKANITFTSSTELRVVLPVSNTGNYTVGVFNSNSTGALYSSSFVISTMPQWLTSATLAGVTTNTGFSNTLSATSDSSVTYSNTTILPTGVILLSNGYYYGTITSNNTYSFDVKATNAENQDSTRTFSLSALLPVVGDNFYSSTGVILKSDGSFIDESYYASAITNSSTPGTQIATDIKKYGSGSAQFVRSETRQLSVATNSNLDLTGSFTMESWVYLTSYPTGLQSICGKWGGSNYSYLFVLTSTGSMESLQLYTYFNEGASGPSFVFNPPNWNLNTWYHIAVVRNGNDLRAFLNGIQIGSTQTYSGTPATRAGPLTIGSAGVDNHYLSGYLDDLRITKGIARYTTTFTPPDSVPVTSSPLQSYRYFRVTLNSVNGGGSQAQLTELSFRDSAGNYITQTLSSPVAPSDGSLTNLNNQNASNLDDTNMNPLPFVVNYDMVSQKYLGTDVKFLRIGSSDDSTRYVNNITVSASNDNSNFTEIFSGIPPSYTGIRVLQNWAIA